jgi:RsiW-degrading membrane proteinase PrsW (M82 family)
MKVNAAAPAPNRVGPPRRWLVSTPVIAAALLGTVALIGVNATQLAALHADEVLRRPPPPIGVWRVFSALETTVVALHAFALALGAAVPAGLILVRLARHAGLSRRHVIASATFAMVLVGALGGRIQPVIRAATGIPAPDGSAWNASSVLLTPAVEELLLLGAAAMVLASRPHRAGLRAGVVIGAAAGIGMTIEECVLYTARGFLAEGLADPVGTIALRFALLGFNLHPVTAALTAGALGGWLASGARPRGLASPVTALVGAIAIHGAWNLATSDLATGLVAVVAPGQDPIPPTVLFAVGSVIATAFLAIPFAVLARAWRRDRPPELATTVDIAASTPGAVA